MAIRILIFHSICCWNTRDLLLNLAKKLSNCSFEVSNLLPGSLRCSLFSSPNLSHPKEINCERNRRDLAQAIKDLGLKTVVVSEYIDSDFCIYAKKWIEERKGVPLNQLCFRGIQLWEVLKGSIAKDFKLDDVSIYSKCPLASAKKDLLEFLFSAIFYIEAAPKVLRDEKPDWVLLFNGYFYMESLLRQFAQKLGIHVLAFERSLFKSLYYFSKTGFAGNRILSSTLSRADIKRIPFDSGKEQETKEFFLGLSSTVPQPDKKPTTPGIKSNYALFIAQVPFDTVVIYDNPLFTSSFHAICQVYDHARELGIELVVKLHPFEGLLTAFRTGHLLRQSFPELCIIEDGLNTRDLIRNSKFVVTINSQAGIEALMERKHVLALGTPYYGKKGFTFDLTEVSLLKEKMQRITDTSENVKGGLFWRFMSFLKEYELFSVTDKEDDLLPESFSRLNDVLDNSRF